MEVQGWLVRQAVAYNRSMQNQASVQKQRAPASDHTSDLKEKVSEKQSPVQKAMDMLNAHGMKDAAEALQQASTEGQQSKPEDPYWDKPPAVKHFLIIRNKLHAQMQQVSTIAPRQLLRTFDMQVAHWPTFLEAVQHFPEACAVKFELSEFLQRQIEEMQVGIRELELGCRMFLSDLLERNSDLVMQQLNGSANRKLVEAEFVRAFKRCGDSNEAVQCVTTALKAPSVPTPSWREAVSNDGDTPRSLGASYRIGGTSASGTAAQRKAAGRDTARMAAQQEKQVAPATPSTEGRYRNADAINTLRKMLKENPDLGNLPAEQQLRLAARRVNRRIDFQAKPARESSAVKRGAGEDADVSDEDDIVASPKTTKPLKARRSLKKLADKNGGDGSDPNDSDSVSGASAESGARQSSDSDSGHSHRSDESGVENSDSVGSLCGSDDDDSRGSDEQYDESDGFCVSDDDAGTSDADDQKSKKAKKKSSKQSRQEASASKRASSMNSLGTPKKSETVSSASQGGNVYFGEDELKKWTTGSEKYKQGFNWPAYIHHKQSYDNYCQFKGVHAARTFKSVIHARLVPAICGFCGLSRLKWKDYEDATVILAIEKALRPSKSTDFALELKQIHIADDKELSLMQNYTAFFENFSYKVAEAEDANRSIKPNVVRSTFKAAIAGHEILKLWLEEVPWRGLNKANARLLRKLREVRSWEQLQRKGITSAPKRQRVDEGEAGEARPRQEGKRAFRGTRAGKAFSLKKRGRLVNPRGRNNFGAAGGSNDKRAPSKFQSGRASGEKRRHPGLDQRGESWHDNKDLFECFNSPCQAPFCQRCGRHGHTAGDCRIPDEAPGINLKGYYQEEKKGKARIAGPPPRNNAGMGADESDHGSENSNDRGKNNGQRGSGRRCLQ
jgi:hypothetical protein